MNWAYLPFRGYAFERAKSQEDPKNYLTNKIVFWWQTREKRKKESRVEAKRNQQTSERNQRQEIGYQEMKTKYKTRSKRRSTCDSPKAYLIMSWHLSSHLSLNLSLHMSLCQSMIMKVDTLLRTHCYEPIATNPLLQCCTTFILTMYIRHC